MLIFIMRFLVFGRSLLLSLRSIIVLAIIVVIITGIIFIAVSTKALYQITIITASNNISTIILNLTKQNKISNNKKRGVS